MVTGACSAVFSLHFIDSSDVVAPILWLKFVSRLCREQVLDPAMSTHINTVTDQFLRSLLVKPFRLCTSNLVALEYPKAPDWNRLTFAVSVRAVARQKSHPKLYGSRYHLGDSCFSQDQLLSCVEDLSGNATTEVFDVGKDPVLVPESPIMTNLSRVVEENHLCHILVVYPSCRKMSRRNLAHFVPLVYTGLEEY